MALLPNILLPVTAEPRANPSPSAREPSRDDASSFARVYAQERQARPTGRESAATSERPAAPGRAESPARTDSGGKSPAHDEVSNEEGANEPALPLTSLTPSLSGSPAAVCDSPLDDQTDPLALWSPMLAAVFDTPVEADAAPGALAPVKGEPEATKGLVMPGAMPTPSMADALTEEGSGLDDLSSDSLAAAQGAASDMELPGPPRELPGSRLGLPPAVVQQPESAPQRIPGPPLGMQPGGFSEGVVERVMWMSSQNLKSAEIQLDPAELGRMEVRIEISKDQAQVTFLSPHANVREALESQMYRLRELFSQQGMSLLEASVSDQSSSRGWQGQSSSAGARGPSGQEEGELSGSVEIAGNREAGGRGLVDYYA